MPFLTVCVVVIDDGKVMLTKRNDFHIWCLPSGGVEDGETAVEAAIRETKEVSPDAWLHRNRWSSAFKGPDGKGCIG